MFLKIMQWYMLKVNYLAMLITVRSKNLNIHLGCVIAQVGATRINVRDGNFITSSLRYLRSTKTAVRIQLLQPTVQCTQATERLTTDAKLQTAQVCRTKWPYLERPRRGVQQPAWLDNVVSSVNISTSNSPAMNIVVNITCQRGTINTAICQNTVHRRLVTWSWGAPVV